jgi:hypothetical protein
MRGLDPRIHHLRKSLPKWMDCRVKPGNDGWFRFPGAMQHAAKRRRAALRPGHAYAVIARSQRVRPLAGPMATKQSSSWHDWIASLRSQ